VGEFFLMNFPKGTSLSDFTRFEPLIVQIRSRFFFFRWAHKKGHYIKSQTSYILPICGQSPSQPNSTKIGVGLSVGVADVINHTKFGNDWSREYKVTEGHIVACSIGMACRLYH